MSALQGFKLSRFRPLGDGGLALTSEGAREPRIRRLFSDRSIERLTDDPLTEPWPQWSGDGESLWYSAKPTEGDLWMVEIRELPWR